MINKKNFKSALCIFTAVLFITVVNVPAADIVPVQHENEAWLSAGEYPVTPESPEWESMSYTECLNACQMPEEMLSDRSTEELSEYVLAYAIL